MKISKRHLKRIIKEASYMGTEDKGAHVLDYLKDKARSYHRDLTLDADGDNQADAGSVKMLLQDDFIDDFGHEFDISDFAYEIDMYSAGVGLDEGKKTRITKRQLRIIIKEEKAKLQKEVHPDYEGLPQSDIDYYELADDYGVWVKQNGHMTPAASSVMASYFLAQGLEDDHAKHEMLGKAFRVSHDDIMRDIKRQQSERSALKESIRNLLKEQMDDDFYEFRHQEDQKELEDYRADVVFEIIEANQGISGPELVTIALRNSVFGGAQAKDVHETLDFLLDYGDVRFDHKEDKWSTER